MSSNKIAIVVAGFIGALWLPSTAQAQSVTAERALLNRFPAPSWGTATTAFTQPDVIDGERALLNHHHAVILNPVESAVADAPSVDGVKALLNRSST